MEKSQRKYNKNDFTVFISNFNFKNKNQIGKAENVAD